MPLKKRFHRKKGKQRGVGGETDVSTPKAEVAPSIKRKTELSHETKTFPGVTGRGGKSAVEGNLLSGGENLWPKAKRLGGMSEGRAVEKNQRKEKRQVTFPQFRSRRPSRCPKNTN